MIETRYPSIRVRLAGTDGNAFAILGKVSNALAKGGVGKEERDDFLKEAVGGDYDHLLQVCMQWVEID